MTIILFVKYWTHYTSLYFIILSLFYFILLNIINFKLIIIQMNLLNLLCCREKKPPLVTKVVTVKPQTKNYQSYQPKSQPFINADKYIGEENNGLPHGNGQMFYKNGDYYRGEWVNGKRQGRGVQMYHQTNTRYEGQWKDNHPNGQGKLTFENQSYYIGQFKDNQQHGKGQFFDFQQNTSTEQVYQNGVKIQQMMKQSNVPREEQFPTLVLDKERFNSEDLLKFQQQNPQIKQLQIQFLSKYFAICKIIKLPFIQKQIKEWTVGEVIDFLQAIDLQFYKEGFYKNRIKGKDLITISQKQMKEDLKMKLGDRKRLRNYSVYLTQLYNPEQKKKKQSKKQIGQKKISNKNFPRAQSLNSSQFRSSKYKTAVEDIIQERSQSFKSSFQHSQKSQEKEEKQKIKQKFGTDEWDQYLSNMLYSMAIPIIPKHQIVEEDRMKAPPKSQCQSSSSSENNSKKSGMKNSSIRKISQDNIDEQISSIHLKAKHSLGLYNGSALLAIQADGGHQKKSSTQSSVQSIQSVQLELQRKKTSVNRHKDGGMQMRELYEFLKERGNLQFIIKPKDIQILEWIGQGGYGKVYKGKYMSCPVAIKDYIKAGKHKSQEDFLKQLEILSDLKHPNIVLYMGLCITSDKYQLVTEYLQNGSLFDQLHKKKKKFTRDEIVQIIDDIVKGMVYLHNMKNILHRDLKSSNVLIGQDWKVKLCDFGLSGHKKKKTKKNKGRVGTYQWMAPQVMRKEQMDFFSDVYSFGVIIWELITEKIPYQGYNQAQIIGEVGYDQNYELKIQNSEWPQDDFVVQLMRQCLKRKASQRPTFIQIQSKLTNYLIWLQGLREKTYSY